MRHVALMRYLVLSVFLLAGLAQAAVATPTLNLVQNPSFACHSGSGTSLCFCCWQGTLCGGKSITISTTGVGHASSSTCHVLQACVCGGGGAAGSGRVCLGVKQLIGGLCPGGTYRVHVTTCAHTCASICGFSAAASTGEACLSVGFGGQCDSYNQCSCCCCGVKRCSSCGSPSFCFGVTAPGSPGGAWLLCPTCSSHLATFVSVNGSAAASGFSTISAGTFAFASLDPTISIVSTAPEIQGSSALVPALAVLGLLAIVADRRRRSGPGHSFFAP
ncbi:MAG TPA: hypothetical protein VGO93_19780 [Candidatus Xenobia bacterium]